MNKIKNIFALFILLMLSPLILAHGEETFTEAEKIIDSKISCDQLTDNQLNIIGEYYMEQMHPGEAHEMMDKMMGGEGSESLRQVHITMAKRLYCNENIGGMMGMMNMMGGGMMGGYPLGYSYANGYWNIFWILLFAAVIFLIVWTAYRFGMKKTASETHLNILKKRFAKGEISKKQYEEMKKELK